ncbi:MAG: hypothetical protein KDB90_04815 [Planctomycetes bacterium]|nr:hypothetical protein [Planctomycetota bacterium]
MEVALQIQRRRMPSARDCAGWYVPGRDPSALLEGLAKLGLEPLPRLYRLAGGFLVRLDAPACEAFPGGVRLAEIATGVFVPLDAELSPALLADEVSGLTRGVGVLCLPEGFYAVDLSAPLSLAAVLAAEVVRRRDWKALPEPPERATAIAQFILDLPENDAEQVLDRGGDGIAEEEAGAEETGAGRSMLGSMEFAAGKALGGLGKLLGNGGMQKAGGKLMGKGLSNDPSRLQGLLGKQEAQLRDLLRRFREGNIEEALRRALPVGGEAGRGARASMSTNLPFHNLLYSLGNLIGGGSGGASMWFTEPDVYGALVAEYRKAAEQARRDGDFRRAAFIYGKLLSDYRTAANVLQQGGLHRDAAILYLKKLNDPMSAARSFEAAGDVDEAVRLYRKIAQHVPAGDLLRKAGDEPAALDEYRTAGRLLSERGEYKAAGELMMAKSAEHEEALQFFGQGWRARPHPNAVPCAVHMAVIHADREEPGRLVKLTDEADRFFNPPGNEAAAGQYYNMLATLARREALAGQRSELHDRALNGLANKLRQRGGANHELPFESKAWSNALVSDAQFALRAEARRRPQKGPRDNGVISSVQIATGVVTCACMAERSGQLFIGFRDGRIFGFSPSKGTVLVRDAGPQVMALTCDEKGELVTAMHHAPDDWRDFSCYVRAKDGNYHRGRGNLLLWHDTQLLCAGDVQGRNQAVLEDSSRNQLALRQGEGLEPYVDYDAPDSPCVAGALVRSGGVTGMLLVGDRKVYWMPTLNAMRTVTEWQSAASHWRAMGFIAGAELSIRPGVPGDIEIAGRNEHGSLYWSGLKAGSFGLRCESRIVAARGDYLCAALHAPGKVAGVTGSHVNWFRKDGEGFVLKSITQVSTPDAVAAFHCADTGELLVLSGQGRVSMISVP